MACEIIRSPGALFAVWGVPEAADVDRLLSELKAAAAEAGGPVVYITRVPVGAPPPKGDARNRLDALMPELLEHCASFHVLLEGDGFVAAFKRGVLTNLLQPFWKQRVFFVHADTADVLAKVSPERRANAEELLRTARLRGLTIGPLRDAAPGA
jgi:hypothetical protein